MKRILINVNCQRTLRVARIEGQHLYSFSVQNLKKKYEKSSIYKGKITRIEPSLEAVFVDYGAIKSGFLPIKEITSNYFENNLQDSSRDNIKKSLKINQELIVQIIKGPRGQKGAALTTFISLSGRYLVLMPYDNGRCVSHKISHPRRERLKKYLGLLKIPKDIGIILRTAGAYKNIAFLQKSINFELKVWKKIQQYFRSKESPCLIYRENSIFREFLINLPLKEVNEILTDNFQVFQALKYYANFQEQCFLLDKIKFYSGREPLFSHFSIEAQIESAYQRKILLPSGGSVVIENTEALTSIDVNSCKSKNEASVEETAFDTNLEAINEITRQLRLRNMGGLIVVDLIDMQMLENKRSVESFLEHEIRQDKAKTQFNSISRFGIIEMSRQLIFQPLQHKNCDFDKILNYDANNVFRMLEKIKIISEHFYKENKNFFIIAPFNLFIALKTYNKLLGSKISQCLYQNIKIYTKKEINNYNKVLILRLKQKQNVFIDSKCKCRISRSIFKSQRHQGTYSAKFLVKFCCESLLRLAMDKKILRVHYLMQKIWRSFLVKRS